MVANENDQRSSGAGVQGLEEADKLKSLQGNYLNQLVQQIAEVKMRVAEEDAGVGELEDFIGCMEGKLAATRQKTEELQVPELQGMLNQAKEEFEKAKLEYEELSRQVLVRSEEMLRDIQEATIEVEELRLQYTGPSTVKELIQAEEQMFGSLKSEMDAILAEIEENKAGIEKVVTDLQAFADSEQLLEYYRKEKENIKMRIDELRALLRAKRGEGCSRYP